MELGAYHNFLVICILLEAFHCPALGFIWIQAHNPEEDTLERGKIMLEYFKMGLDQKANLANGPEITKTTRLVVRGRFGLCTSIVSGCKDCCFGRTPSTDMIAQQCQKT